MNEKKLLLFSTPFFILITLLVFQFRAPPTTFSIDVAGQFTYGSLEAPVHMILFEEFACPRCQLFHRETLPIIEKGYVQSGKVRVTLIPLAFLDDSITACNLSLCVQKESPAHTKTFFDFLFNLSYEDLTTPSARHLLGLYHELPSSSLLQVLRKYSFESERERNLSLAKQVYPGDILVPIILINGKLIPNNHSLTQAIDAAL